MTDYTNHRFKEYSEKILALRPINTDAKAKEYARIFLEYYPPKKDAKRPTEIESSLLI